MLLFRRRLLLASLFLNGLILESMRLKGSYQVPKCFERECGKAAETSNGSIRAKWTCSDCLKRMITCSDEQWESMIANNQAASIEHILNWLGEILVLEDIAVNELIDQFPRVLLLNISEHLDPISHFNTEYIGLEEARRFVANHPQVLGVSLEKRLQPRLEQVQRARMVADAGWLKSMALHDEEK
jgi:hypothetical protein